MNNINSHHNDLQVLPTEELFWLNLEEGYFACQLNESEKFLKIFKISRLCDYKDDCYLGSDELYDELRWVVAVEIILTFTNISCVRCSRGCDPPCLNGVCLTSRPESQVIIYSKIVDYSPYLTPNWLETWNSGLKLVWLHFNSEEKSDQQFYSGWLIYIVFSWMSQTSPRERFES